MCASWHLITKEIVIQFKVSTFVCYEISSILTRTIPNNKKYCQMAYMLLNDNLKIFLVTTKKLIDSMLIND
jgi:hypothetical protein